MNNYIIIFSQESEVSSEMTEVVPLSSPYASDSTGASDTTLEDMMFSDAASRGDVSISTDSGSGTGSDDDTDITDVTGGINLEIVHSNDKHSTEGSGMFESEVTESSKILYI